MSLRICGGQVFNSIRMVLERADVIIEGDRIAAVGPDFPVLGNAEELNAKECIVLPGLINAHTHAHNNLTKGLGDNWTLEDQLNHGPALNANRTSEEQYFSAALGAVEMLKTRVNFP
jgi:5-methylthioadenosine/S-adenosylhomocysteine deaminase